MRILVVQDGDWIKKGPHQQHHLMELLSVKGYQIKVICYDQLWRDTKKGIIYKREEIPKVSRFYKGASIDVIRPSFIKLPVLDYISFLLTSRKEIKTTITEFKPDVVIGFTSVLSNYWGMKYSKQKNTPFVYYWTDVIHELITVNIFRQIAKHIEKKIIKGSTSIMVINESLKDYLIEFDSVNPSDIRVIPGGIDFNRFDVAGIDPLIIREKYGISKDDLLLFFMGWIYEFSGLPELVLELSKVKDIYPNIKLLVVGKGDYYTQLKEFVEQNHMEDRVILTGQRPYEEIPQLVAAADICLLPAHNNAIMKDIVPIKMYEYLAMHKPIISTKLPGVMREFKENNGVIYADNPENVLKRIIDLKREDIQRNSTYAREFIKNYEWNKIVSEFDAILREMVYSK